MTAGSWTRYGWQLVDNDWRLRPCMPRIEQRFIGTSLYMYRTAESAYDGTGRGGSGVLIGQPSERIPSTVHLYAVTNAHVVERGGVVARARKRDGESRVFDLEPGDWRLHPRREDVALCWLETASMDDDQELQWVPRDWLTTEHHLGLVARSEWGHPWSTGPIVPGEETFSVARFIGYDGRERNQPTVRFGNLSSAELVPVSQRPDRDRDQESLLVEARSLLGYSGAPVFAYRTGGYIGGGEPPVRVAALLGVGWGHIKHPRDEEQEYEIEMESPGQPTVGRYNSGIMAVVPAWMIAELLDDEKVVAMRREYEDEATQEGMAELDVSENEFEQFESLTRKLVNVPKKEINEKRKDES